MTLHTVAKHLQEHGRGPDDQLVHMSTKELAGLQALAQQHGGSLTQNPHTGLPEAGFLDSILPTVLGAAATFAFPELSAFEVAGGIGAIQAARTGDLGKGLMAGLGAFGGAGMVGGLSAAGTAAAQQEALAAAGITPEIAAGMSPAEMDQVLGSVSQADKIAAGAKGLTLGNAASSLGGWKTLGAAAAPALLDALGTQKQLSPQGNTGTIRPYTYAANPVYNSSSNPNPTQAGARPLIGATYQPGQDTSERTYFNPQYTAQTPYTYTAAQGGQVPGYAMGGTPTSTELAQNATGANMNYPQAHNQAMGYANAWQTPIAQGPMGLASGGLASLGSYSDGGQMLKGPGDGMSDSIPAQIGQHQPARLGNEEFVVPADVVSHLGNGSSDAGAKQLYKMMDRVRTARTGHSRQGKEINPEKYMPA